MTLIICSSLHRRRYSGRISSGANKCDSAKWCMLTTSVKAVWMLQSHVSSSYSQRMHFCIPLRCFSCKHVLDQWFPNFLKAWHPFVVFFFFPWHPNPITAERTCIYTIKSRANNKWNINSSINLLWMYHNRHNIRWNNPYKWTICLLQLDGTCQQTDLNHLLYVEGCMLIGTKHILIVNTLNNNKQLKLNFLFNFSFALFKPDLIT